MKQTLIIYGSLGVKGFKHSLKQALSEVGSENVSVLEVESLLPAEQRPNVGVWVNAMDLQSPAELRQFDHDLDELLTFYLDAFSADSSGSSALPLSRQFRAACLGSTCKKWISPYQVNLDLAKKMFSAKAYDRIIVTPGSGISFRAWQQVGEAHGIPVHFLDKEPRPLSLSRRWARLMNRWRKRPVAVAESLPDALSQQNVEVLCTSGRLARILQQNASKAVQSKLDWAYLSVTSLGKPSTGDLQSLQHGYTQWWDGCEKTIRELIRETPDDPRSILLDLGRQQATEVYPLFAWRYLRALEHLQKVRPRVLLCDMQEGSEERVWPLAAKELNIPVIAYTYDHIPQPQLSIQPDWLLCDSGRNADIAIFRGHPVERILRVASHRQPSSNPTPWQPGGKMLLFADSYYSGTIATVEPQRSYRHYLQILEVARRMPEYQFLIKFHPLRDRKRMEQCFIGMDEDELHVRTEFIRSLKPTPNVKLVDPEKSMMALLPEASLMLNSNSTAAVEACMLGVPVLFLHPPNTLTGFPRILDYEACIIADEADMLEASIKRLTTDSAFITRHIQNQRRYVDEFYWASGQLSLEEGIQSLVDKEPRAAQKASTGTPEAGPKD